MPARIVGGTLRDLSYLASRLRPDDHAEVSCQIPGWTPAGLAAAALQGFAYCVELDGNPEAAFGAREQRTGLWIAWSWGSKRMHRCVPAIVRFFYAVLGPDVVAAGAHRVEARALAGNDLAVRFLKRLGATQRCLLPSYGMNGETFVLWDWTRESWSQAIGGDHLFFLDSEATAAAADADRALRQHGGGAGARAAGACADGAVRAGNGRDGED
jgi:hypothetical protein